VESEPLPVDLDARLEEFAELVAIGISRAQAYDDLRQLAEEQAALRRVATRVAEGAPPNEIVDAVVREIAATLRLQGIEMARYDAGELATVISASGDHPFPAGSSLALDDPSVRSAVFRTGSPARIDDYSVLSGATAEDTGTPAFGPRSALRSSSRAPPGARLSRSRSGRTPFPSARRSD
jgi:hypothetical protein